MVCYRLDGMLPPVRSEAVAAMTRLKITKEYGSSPWPYTLWHGTTALGLYMTLRGARRAARKHAKRLATPHRQTVETLDL